MNNSLYLSHLAIIHQFSYYGFLKIDLCVNKITTIILKLIELLHVIRIEVIGVVVFYKPKYIYTCLKKVIKTK